MKKALPVLIVSALCFSSTQALAEEYKPFYGAVFLGQASWDVDLDTSGASLDDKDTFFSLVGGYKVNENVAVELAYNDFGGWSVSGNGATFVIDATSFSLSAVGNIPINNDFNLLGRLGMEKWDGDATLSGAGSLNSSEGEDGTDLYFGIGGAYKINEKVAIRLEYQLHEFDVGGGDIDVDVLTLGASFVF